MAFNGSTAAMTVLRRFVNRISSGRVSTAHTGACRAGTFSFLYFCISRVDQRSEIRRQPSVASFKTIFCKQRGTAFTTRSARLELFPPNALVIFSLLVLVVVSARVSQ